MSEVEIGENPLVPNRKLREIYVAMVKLRSKTDGRARRGEEAGRVGTSIDLGAGDLVSDSRAGVAMDSLLADRPRTTRKEQAAPEAVRQMPGVKDAGEGLWLAVGAALSFKVMKQQHVVVAYVRRGEVGRGEWRRVLGVAAKLEAPIFFVVLPGANARKKSKEARLNKVAQACGIPGMVADASDVVALYRIAQETLGRLRGGGGPVLVECLAFEAPARRGERGAAHTDPVDQMKAFLLERRVATKEWLGAAGGRATTRRRKEESAD